MSGAFENKYNLVKTLVFIRKIQKKYEIEEVSLDYVSLYQKEGELKDILAFFHKKLDDLFRFMNSKYYPDNGGHFNASESRELLDLIEELKVFKRVLKDDNVDISLNSEYQKHIDYSNTFLVKSGGSPIPSDYKRIEIQEYDPIFTINNGIIKKFFGQETVSLKTVVVGSGAFAIVSSYVDNFYEKKFAIKKLKDTNDVRIIHRFKQEFDILKKLDFPYILKVYKYYESEYKYIMEYCDTNLHDFIEKNNQKLQINTRKRIILQFLYAVNYLHSKKILHRDISYRNILVQIYDNNVPMIKLSDFGLVKLPGSEFTKSETELKGTILDFTLESFKDYNLKNEIYCIGHVINYIASGKKGINNNARNLFSNICDKCVRQNHEERYGNVQDIINDVEQVRF